MKSFPKVHHVQLDVRSPLHVGDGTTITKKEYHVANGKIQILDIPKLYGALSGKGATAEKEFEDYLLLKKTFTTVPDLARRYSLRLQDYVRYELDNSLDREDFKKLEIKAFIKDPYGYPYIPGSSLKGAIRTALIAYRIYHSSDLKSYFMNGFDPNQRDIGRFSRELEKKFDGPGDRKFLSGLTVSDSKPVTENNALVLAQKIDYSLDLKSPREHPLPIFREALRPKIKVDFTITLDTDSLGGIDINYIREALDFHQKQAYRYFHQVIDKDIGDDHDGTIWLGGGAGFTSKSIIYQIFEDQAFKVANDIFRSQLSPKIYQKHNHDKEEYRSKLTPHMGKCTMYNNLLYDMGRARITFID